MLLFELHVKIKIAHVSAAAFCALMIKIVLVCKSNVYKTGLHACIDTVYLRRKALSIAYMKIDSITCRNNKRLTRIIETASWFNS